MKNQTAKEQAEQIRLTGEFISRCPPEGGTKPFVVTMNGKPFASFETSEQADAARTMYCKPVKLAKGGDSFNARQAWAITKR